MPSLAPINEKTKANFVQSLTTQLNPSQNLNKSGELTSKLIAPPMSTKTLSQTTGFISNISSGVANLNSAAGAFRDSSVNDKKGFFQTALDFGKNVSEIYSKMSELAPQLGVQDQDKRFLEVAKHYTMSRGYGLISELGSQTVSAATQQSINSNTSNTANTPDSIWNKIMGAAGAAQSVYEIFGGRLNSVDGAMQGMATGAYIGSMFGAGPGTAIGAVVGGLGGLISGMLKKSGKPIEQKERDLIRKQLQSVGILDSNWQITLANGLKFDLGKDGGAKLRNLDGGQRSYKEFDLSNPLTQAVAKFIYPLAQKITSGHERLSLEFTAYLTNAVNSNSESIEQSLLNIKEIYSQFGLSFNPENSKTVAKVS
jgi:hypothetical protein